MRYLVRKYGRRAAGVLALVMFAAIIGAVGDMEIGAAGMLETLMRLSTRLVMFLVLVYLAGGFEDSKERGNKNESNRAHKRGEGKRGNERRTERADRLVG